MKVIALGASSSSTSINQQLAKYALSLLKGVDGELLDINDYEMPIFSEDLEKSLGQPPQSQAFVKKVNDSDALIISFAEHNGSYSAAWKNLFDWCSRINHKIYQGKQLVLLATSPGAGGGASVLSSAANSVPHFGGELKGSLSIPKFYENFDTEAGKLTNADLDQQLQNVLKELA